MAKANPPQTRRATPASVPAVTPKLVSFVQPPAAVNDDAAASIPDPWQGRGQEAPSNLTPAADWQTPGEYIDGDYLGFTDGVGPNQSRLYHMKHRGTFVSVWGATILDARIDTLNPPRGAQIMIQYLGTVQTGRGLSPAKNFRVKMM